MTKQTTQIPISSIILDEDIYPRKGIDPRRVGIFAENIRDGFKFEPIEVEPAPEKPGKYRLLDGVHRWSAYKTVGVMEPEAVIKDLRGIDPLLYAAKKAIGPKQLTEDEARDTARRAYNKNPTLTSSDIGKAVGRSRQTVDSYIADLRAATQMDLDIKIFRMDCLGIPQDRIAKRLGQVRETIRDHLAKMPELANPPNADLSQGFTVSQVAEKHNWTEPMVWPLALKDKEDLVRFKELGWGLRTKEKPDLIIFDPPYFDKKAADYDKKSISGLPKKEYLEFLEAFFALLKQSAKKTTRLAFINADWRDFQNKPAVEESHEGSILIDDYLGILNKTGWQHTHIIQAPMSA